MARAKAFICVIRMETEWSFTGIVGRNNGRALQVANWPCTLCRLTFKPFSRKSQTSALGRTIPRERIPMRDRRIENRGRHKSFRSCFVTRTLLLKNRPIRE